MNISRHTYATVRSMEKIEKIWPVRIQPASTHRPAARNSRVRTLFPTQRSQKNPANLRSDGALEKGKTTMSLITSAMMGV